MIKRSFTLYTGHGQVFLNCFSTKKQKFYRNCFSKNPKSRFFFLPSYKNRDFWKFPKMTKMFHIINRSKNGQNPIFSRKLENSHSSPYFYRNFLKTRLLTKNFFWTFWLILADFLKILGRGSPLVPTSVVR